MSTMQYHYETMGRILSHLVNQGLSRVDFEPSDAMDIMTERRGSEEEVLKTFTDVLHWMHDEDLIRVSSLNEYEGGFSLLGVQLTSKGIAIIQTETKDAELGDTIERKVAEHDGEFDSSIYAKIGELVGSLAGSFTKSISSG
jgi:hypothetical protein